jgi:hypothetical protein
LWHEDPLLDNDRETNNYTTVVTRQKPISSNKVKVFSARAAPIAARLTIEELLGKMFSVLSVKDKSRI